MSSGATPCTDLITYDVCDDGQGLAYCVLHPLGCDNSTDLRLESAYNDYSTCANAISPTSGCKPVGVWKRCDNGTGVNCVLENAGCSTSDGWVEGNTETLVDQFATKCACQDYVHYVICLTAAGGDDYECVPDYEACPGTGVGNTPVSR